MDPCDPHHDFAPESKISQQDVCWVAVSPGLPEYISMWAKNTICQISTTTVEKRSSHSLGISTIGSFQTTVIGSELVGAVLI